MQTTCANTNIVHVHCMCNDVHVYTLISYFCVEGDAPVGLVFDCI